MKILLISTADLDHPFWTNKQHEAYALAELGHQVLYVESLGLRKFSAAGGSDARRSLRRLMRAARGARRVSERLHVASPLVLPGWATPGVRNINILAFRLQRLVWRLQWGKPDLIWTFNPVTGVLLGAADRTPVLYHCVDAIASQPGMAVDFIRAAEVALLRRASVIFTTAPSLTESAVKVVDPGRVVEHTNAVDFKAFREGVTGRAPTDLPEAEILVGFVGALSRYKFDVSLVVELANVRPSWTIVLIGEEGEGQPGDRLHELHSLPNVAFLGGKPRNEVPVYMANFDVGIIPAPLNEYTESMFPMKFFEYLASGIPVVATPLPALAAFHGLGRTAASGKDFADAIELALAGVGIASLSARLEEAERHSYDARTRNMLKVIAERLDLR